MGPDTSNEGFGMAGQLRPGLRADDDDDVEVVIAAVLTVVLVEGVEEETAGADGVCSSLAEGSTLRWIFSTLTAGVRLEEKITDMRSLRGNIKLEKLIQKAALGESEVDAGKGLFGQNVNPIIAQRQQKVGCF